MQKVILKYVLKRLWIVALAGLALPVPAKEIKYYHLDAQGNVRVVTDQSGAVVERHDYLPFGEECTTGGCASNPGLNTGEPRKFTGKERDRETGLDYFGARYYQARTGRFTSIDPVYTWQENLLDPQRWNRYAYVRNNPLRYVDPDGRELRLVGHEDRAVEAVRLGVPASDRGFIQAKMEGGRMIIDPTAINEGRASESENFQALRQIVNSPGVVELDASSDSLRMRTSSGIETIPFSGTTGPGFTGAGSASAQPGVIEVFVQPRLDRGTTAAVTAHELRHARRRLLGQPYQHERSEDGKRDPKGAVNRETTRAQDEARRVQ